ncbi:hypothetical protein, conserved [Angomonas deanei]|uniref:EGF-like domain-containing protein n=1 Tax=Angomonas deanei TaxID=59799 RepID=A0A7G2CEM2_9TRYP|nr:hypothetical protein, conserved [Angomonas deanei]
MKTCAQAPCTGCSSPSGDDDTCATCSDPYVFEASTSQCTGCIAGYKKDGTTCVEKGCSVENCQTCVFDTEDQCKTCKDNYKLEGTTCTMKTCAQAPCTGCSSPSGDDDTCATCSDPYVFEASTSQCTGCIAGYKKDGTTCVEKGCSVENCQTCVFDTEDQCKTCKDNYKLEGTTCTMKTCAQAPCTGCSSPSGDDDTCATCSDPYVFEASTSQCTGCIAGYKKDGTTCVEKGCSVENCQTCVFDTEDQCKTCKDNYKLEGTTCTMKTCAQAPCTGCSSPSGDDDTCATCSDPYVFEASTAQCTGCIAGYKKDGTTCVEKGCSVENCQTCVFDTEDRCKTCNTNLKPDGNGGCTPMQCSVANCTKCVDNTEDQCESCTVGSGPNCVVDRATAKSGGSGLSTASIIGIVVACAVVVLGILFLIIFLCCRRKQKKDTENVDESHDQERRGTVASNVLDRVRRDSDTLGRAPVVVDSTDAVIPFADDSAANQRKPNTRGRERRTGEYRYWEDLD